MGKTLADILPDPMALLELAPEELAGVVLEVLVSLRGDEGLLSLINFTLQDHIAANYPTGDYKKIGEALTEAWVWLEREGFIAPRPGSHGGWVFVTRRGRRIQGTSDLQAYRRAGLLPKEQLHPVIAQKVSSSFLRGEYDTAVFQAFKEVEIAVRDAGKFGANEYGVKLMRNAFHTENGPLTDKRSLEAERQALCELFAGAIGSYKNPHSHRNIPIGPDEAVEMIIMASHLLRIVDSRKI